MPTDPRKRQKKQERRAAKRKQKRQFQTREQNLSLGERLRAATRYPVLDCGISESMTDSGIGWVILSRETPGGQVAVAVFLVDRYCLGVKDCFAELLGRSSYESKYARKFRSEMAMRPVPPAEARKFLHDAVAYARNIGLPPHPSYLKSVLLFGDIDPAECKTVFEFGKDGMPFFISGPNDTPERIGQILAILNSTCGPGRFHYLIGGPDPRQLREAIPDALQGEDMRLIGPDGEEDFPEDEEDSSEDADR